VVRTVQADGHTEYTPIGHTANLAARMQTAAPAGSIAAGAATRRLCEGYFNFRSLGPVQVKGVSEPVEIYEVVGIGPLRTHFQLAVRRGRTRFVGRAAELAQLGRALELARAGRGQVIAAIRGVPFIENLARLDQSMILVIDITKCRDLLVALCNAPNVV
jgi:adenylate cyclase